MLLSLFRFTMIVSLLISVVCIEANERSRLEKSKAAEGRNAHLNEDANEETFVQKRDSDKRDSSRVGVSSMEQRIPRQSGNSLAHKMAKEALKSPKMQETMQKLTKVSKSKGSLSTSVKVPSLSKVGVKKSRMGRKEERHKGRRKKKRKRHHRRYGRGRSSWSGTGSSKQISSIASDVDAKTLNRRENSLFNDNLLATNDDRSPTIKSHEKVTHVRVDDSEYIDFTSPFNIEPSEPPMDEGSINFHGSERMIENLMRTTTRDPLKKKPVDQGIEYSDYYSDDDVLHDIAANKIPMEVVRLDSNDRLARYATNYSLHPRIDRNVHPYQDRFTRRRRKDFRYPGRYQYPRNYPKVERFAALDRNSRFLGDDPSKSYLPNYNSINNGDESLNTVYSISTEEIEPAQGVEQETVPETVRDNSDSSDSRKLNDIEEQNVNQLYHLNPYESLGTNEGTVPQMENYKYLPSENLGEYPQLPNNYPESPNYQSMDTSLQRVGNTDQNAMSQFKIDDMQVPSSTEGIIAQSQSTLSPIQSYSNEMKSVSVQDKNNLDANNAMDQPLGKVLESLGINVNTDSSNSNNLENVSPAMNNEVNDLSSGERALNPNHSKQEAKWEIGKNKGAKVMQSRKDSHFRRQSYPEDIYDNHLSLYTENPMFPTHHMNISIAVQDTKEIASQILDTIMEELEELKLDRAKNNNREGSWSTAQAGMKLDMRVVNRTIIVTVSELVTSRLYRSLLNGTWNVSGHAPFKRGSPFTLIATDNSTKSVAVFVGACRVCQGVDTIQGVWSVARQSKDCRDFQLATSVFNDVFWKTTLSSLKENGNLTSNENATLNHEKRKS